MKISEISNLEKSQSELDFVDIDVEQDKPLYLDPFFLSQREDHWSIEASATVKSFFQQIINLIKSGHMNRAKTLFDHLHEPNSTCLGMSTGRPKGRGVGTKDTDKIFKRILKSRAIETGLIQDLEDNVLFVDQFGKDKLSDMTTNIIRKHLLEYTRDQCKLHGIPLREVPLNSYWDRKRNKWMTEYGEQLVVNGRKILLVPKATVSFSKAYTPNKYYNHYVLEYLQNEHLDIKSALVQRRKSGRLFVTKKSLKDQYPLSKEFLRDFTERYPKVLEEFKEQNEELRSLTNLEIAGEQIDKLAEFLRKKLERTNPGNEDATKYHKLIASILELIFYPHLMYPVLEREIHQGRKRIDITFNNAASEGVFHLLHKKHGVFCPYILVECKNYSSDPKNPELDQLSGRFGTNKGRFGMLLCRNIENEELFLKRCADTYKDGRGLIIPLTDKDLFKLLRNVNEWDSAYLDKYISDKIRNVVMG